MGSHDEEFRSRSLLASADATAYLVDKQFERLEQLLTEVRNTESFVERRRRDRGRTPERRAP